MFDSGVGVSRINRFTAHGAFVSAAAIGLELYDFVDAHRVNLGALRMCAGPAFSAPV